MPPETTPGPAHDINLEVALLGAVFINNQALDHVGDLLPEHFYEPLHQRIFDGCQTLYRAGQEANPLTIRTIIPMDLKVGPLTASQYLASIAAAATTVINAGDYASTIRALWVMREAQSALIDLGRFQERALFPQDALKEAWLRLDTIRLGQPQHSVATESVGQSAHAFMERLQGIMSGSIDAGGIPTGLSDLDQMIGGLKAGDLAIFAGRPGMGKSTVAESIVRNVARNGMGASYLSLEMSRDQTMARFLCDEAFDDGGAPIEYRDALHPKRLAMPSAERLLAARERVDKLPLMIDYSSRLSLGTIAAKARSMALTIKRKFGVDMVMLVIDYLKFIEAGDRYRGNRVYEVGEISAGLKQLAKDEGWAVVLLAQLSRQVEMTEDKIPNLSHLRESGDLEADADLVVFLFRRAYYLQNNAKIGTDTALQLELQDCINTLMLIIAKQRSGPTGNINVFCHMGASAIRSLARQEQIDLSNGC